ncbi:eCIS core domain-containing protein [Streptomyces cinereoruber]
MAREADRSQASEHRHQHTATRAPLPASEALHIQRTAGNSALVQLLRQAGHPWAQEQHQHSAGCGHQQNTQVEQPSVQRSAVHDVLRTSGHPLDDATRTDMEARLGADFSDVRVHDDSAARASAAEVGARAYTSGSHVVIGEGGADKHTLAHELTHVIQQRKGPVAGTDTGDGLKVSDPSDRYEREAETNATRVMSSAAPTHTRMTRDSPTLRAAGAVGELAAVQRLFAADPGRGNVGEDLATAEPLVLADTASAQGEHVFNAFNALAVELADRLEREAPPSSALNTAIATLRQRAARLGELRDNAQFRAAPAGQGNSANATSYSQYIQQIRAAMTDVLAGDPTGGWSRLVGLSHTILDRAMDQDAWNYQNSHRPKKAFERWSKETKDAMTDTFSALLSAVSAARAPQ